MSITTSSNSRALYWAGLVVAVSSFGVVLTSIFYALSPVPAALPIPNVDLTDALNGMLAGKVTMMTAGMVGVISDVLFIAGALLMMVLRRSIASLAELLGWALLAVGVVIFIFVDTLAAGVLTQIAVIDNGLSIFAGFKLLFNILFIFSSITVDVGTIFLLASEIKAKAPIIAKPMAWTGLVFSLVGLLASVLYFANIALPQVIGISIAVISVIFGIYGIQIPRSSGNA